MTKEYAIKRGATTIATVKPEGTISEQIMGDSSVAMSFTLGTYIVFQIGDTVTVDGIQFVLNSEPSFTKVSGIEFKYSLLFQGYKFELAKTAFLFLGDDNSLKEVEFPLMANAQTFVALIVQNMNREHSGWTVGTVDETDYKNLTFSEHNCLSALADLATEFETEYWISGKTIHLTKKGVISGLNLEYGRGNGLYSIGRSQPSDKSVFTRIIARGSDKNIPGTYRGSSTRLQLPGVLNYLERNVDKYGVIEVSRTYDDIYPKREGLISSVVNELQFTDYWLDFDLNDPDILIPGLTAKITFNTGQLAGNTFDIASFDNATKIITVNINKDEKAIDLPSVAIQAAVGDKYVLTDIIMPPAYIEAAEIELEARATADLVQNSDPYAQYSVDPDPLHFKRENIVINLGDYVHITDTEIGIDEEIRVISYKKDIQEYFKYTEIELATVVAISSIVKQYAELEKGQRAIKQNRLTDAARARRNYKTTQELKNLIFDADGYFTDKIKPFSIETTMLSVGAKSQQFILNASVFSPNFAGDKAKIRVTAGTLDHFSLTDTIRTWTLAAYSNDGLVDGIAYYIYAKCDKTGGTGTYLFSTDQITVNQDVSYYHFIIGVLHSPIDGVRGISMTYGQTTINGKFITTGRIQSTDEETYFDLDSGEIGGKIVFTAGSSGYDNLTDKPDLSSLAATAYVDAIMADLQNQIDGQITSWFYNYVPTTANVPATDWTTDIIRDNHLGDLFYNTDNGYAYRYQKVGAVYSWSRITDVDVVAALANAAAAQDTADSKRRVFVTTPVVPYDIGDLWTQGTGGDLMRCSTAKTIAQTYSAGDWVKAVKYTDDTATTALQAALGSVAYENLIQASKLGTTVIEGGYIKSTLLNVSAIVVAGGLETTSGAQTKATTAQTNAATDATNKANAAQTAAIAAAATDATTKANAANTAAQTYAAAQAAYERTVAIAHADGVVDAEETRAIADAIAKLNEAKADATTKANAAQTAATTAAAGYVAALSGSLGTVAYQNAISASMLDSTVIVGGYIKSTLLDVATIIVNGSIATQSYAAGQASSAQTAAQTYAAAQAASQAATAQAAAISAAATDATTKANAAQTAAQTYAAAQAAYERTVATAHADGIVDAEEARAIADAAAKLATAQADATTKANAAQAAAISAASTDATGKSSAAQAAAIAAAATDATTKANAAQAAAQAYATSATAALSSSLGSLAYQSLVAASMLDSTVIVGGYIKTSLLDVDFIKGLNFNFVMGTIGGFTINSTKIVSDQYDGILEIGSGSVPYIKLNSYFYSGGVKYTALGTEITPGGFETSNLVVRNSIKVGAGAGSEGVTGTFYDLGGNLITVTNGIITDL